MNISAKFQLYPPVLASEMLLFEYFSQNLFSRLVVMTTNQIERFGQKVYVWYRTTQQTFLKNQ